MSFYFFPIFFSLFSFLIQFCGSSEILVVLERRERCSKASFPCNLNIIIISPVNDMLSPYQIMLSLLPSSFWRCWWNPTFQDNQVQSLKYSYYTPKDFLLQISCLYSAISPSTIRFWFFQTDDYILTVLRHSLLILLNLSSDWTFKIW